jgi:osmotically-inducible protein OsmY
MAPLWSRAWLNKAADEVRSWFGDRDLDKRRMMDESESFNRDRFGRLDNQQNRMTALGTRGSGMMDDYDMYRNPYQTNRMMQSGRVNQDELYTGDYSHAGRGPKGFQRTDERIKEEAHELLTRHHEIDATDVEIEVKDGEVTLKGMVDSRCNKRLAEDMIEDIFGVKQVHNLLRINKTESGFFLNNENKETRNLATSRR